MNTPLVSVIVPVLNTRPWLDECLESLLAQTLSPIEIICVDNGSTDGSLERLREYARRDQRICVLQHPIEGRQGGARNAGLSVASGGFVGFVDSDDYVSHTMYASLYSAAVEAEAEVTVCNIAALYRAEGRSEIMIPPDRLRRGGAFRIIERLSLLRNLTGCNKLYSASLLGRLGLRFPVGVFFEDQYFVSRALFAACRVSTVPEAHYIYRKQRTGAVGACRGAENLQVFTVMRRLAEDLSPSERGAFAGALAEVKVVRYLGLFGNVGGSYRREYFRRMRDEFGQITLPCPPLFLSVGERREFGAVKYGHFIGHAVFRHVRALYGALRRVAWRGVPAAAPTAYRS